MRNTFNVLKDNSWPFEVKVKNKNVFDKQSFFVWQSKRRFDFTINISKKLIIFLVVRRIGSFVGLIGVLVG